MKMRLLVYIAIATIVLFKPGNCFYEGEDSKVINLDEQVMIASDYDRQEKNIDSLAAEV